MLLLLSNYSVMSFSYDVIFYISVLSDKALLCSSTIDAIGSVIMEECGDSHPGRLYFTSTCSLFELISSNRYKEVRLTLILLNFFQAFAHEVLYRRLLGSFRFTYRTIACEIVVRLKPFIVRPIYSYIFASLI